MRTLTKEMQEKITPSQAVQLLKDGNKRFVSNLKLNRNLLQQVNDTREGQHPFAVVLSCMDSRASAELIFDQGLGDIFSIRIAGNVVNDDIVGSAEFGCKAVGAKAVVVLGHTACGAIKGAIGHVQLGNLGTLLSKIQVIIPEQDLNFKSLSDSEKEQWVTRKNVMHSIEELRGRSSILREMETEGKIKFIGGIYDIQTGEVQFSSNPMYRKIAAEELSRFLGVIAHPERIRIIEELKGGEIDVTEIQMRLDIAQSTVSRHLALLRTHNVVSERKEGRRVFYHLSVPLLANWLISGLDIVSEKSVQKVPLSKAFETAKKLWATGKQEKKA